MSTAIQIEAGPETLHAINALAEQLSMLNAFFAARMPPTTPQAADDDWLTMKEFTEHYKVSPNTVYSKVKEGHIERLEMGGRSPRYRLTQKGAQECLRLGSR